KGSIGFWSPTNQKISQPFAPPTSTHLELQAIALAIKSHINYQNITIYSDFLSSLQLIENIQNNTPPYLLSYPTILNEISHYLNMRTKYKTTTLFHHVYSHLLDNPHTLNDQTAQKKLTIIQIKYKDKYLQILQGNQNIDRL